LVYCNTAAKYMAEVTLHIQIQNLVYKE